LPARYCWKGGKNQKRRVRESHQRDRDRS
jgi:hypothetical protein